MGFLSKIRKGMKKQVAQMPRRRGGFLRGMPMMKPSMGDMRFRGRMPSFNPTIFGQPIPQGADFSNMPDFSQIDMSQLDLSGIPQSISQMDLPQIPEGLPSMEEIEGNRRMPQMRMGEMQPRMMMAGGGLSSAAMAAGRNLPGRMKDLSNKILGRDNVGLKITGQPRDLLEEVQLRQLRESIGMPLKNIPGRNIPNRNIPGTASLNDRLRRGTENAIIGSGLLGGAAVTDATQGFTEQARMQNMMLNSPEQLGKDLAGMRIGLDRLIDIASQKAQEIGAAPGEYVGRAQRAYEAEMEAERMKQLDAEQGLKNVSLLMAGGGEASSFPDLTGDGKVTQADILKGRGVYAEGDEVMMMEETEMMAPGGDEIEASLMEVQGMQPETQMLDQYVQMVIEMVQAGASEAEVIESLRQAGLDDDDIAAVFQAVMETLQGSMEQGGIDAELAQLS